MEVFSALRRPPRRAIFCIYLMCVTFAVCAFYTLYLDSRYSALPNKPEDDVTTSEDPSFRSSYSRMQLEESVPFELEGTQTFSPSALSRTDQKNNSTLPQIFVHAPTTGKSNKPQNTVHADTKYIFLSTSISNTRPSTTPSALVMKSSTPETPTDTCQSASMKDSKLILLWTPFFGTWNYLPKEHFERCTRCRNCRVTKDRSKLKDSDAVIFHARDMSVVDLPSVRYPHQRWVFYCLESPPYSDFPGLQYMQNMINWTMTYREDSDIITEYGTVSKLYPSKKLDLQYLEWVWSNKSKSVAWLSSHCPTHGGRDLYVQELKKYIDVDIYGTCGTSICPPGATDKCYQDFANKYKFFLAFENTICKDYITEKFFRTLKYDIVPVVFGGAKYEKFAPPGSFVDALSFKSPKHLAFFLAGVGRDFRLYKNYFLWRKNFSVSLSNNKECVLCSLLHQKQQKPSFYPDLRAWWLNGSNCRVWKPKR